MIKRMDENIEVLCKFIKRIKAAASPGMYIGSVSLVKLQIYLEGFLQAQCEASGNFSHPFDGFHSYVKRHFNETSNGVWANIILRHTKNEKEAFDMFYKLFEGYINEIWISINRKV